MEVPNNRPQSSSEINLEPLPPPKINKSKFIFCCNMNFVTCSNCCCSLNSAVRTVCILDIILFFLMIFSELLFRRKSVKLLRILRIGGNFSLIVIIIPAIVQIIYACCVDMKRKNPIYLGKVGRVYYYCKLLQILIMIILAIIMSAMGDNKGSLLMGIIFAVISVILQIYFAYILFSYFNLLLQNRVSLVLYGKEEEGTMPNNIPIAIVANLNPMEEQPPYASNDQDHPSKRILVVDPPGKEIDEELN